MKMTIVIDSDDINGIEDAYKMVRIMYTKYVGVPSGAGNKSFGKIEFIKMLRKFGKRAVEDYKTDEGFELEDISTLRYTKTYADEIWRAKGD
tara:strand:+ start:804 stop:1079 length:276 start_codon:yes stop_codon:yes gene_type:complete